MFLYMTSGTPDFMRKLKAKHATEGMIQLFGEGGSLLLHETEQPSVFASPRKYEVLDSTGDLTPNGFFVMNNIPVAEESRPAFEHRFLDRAGRIEDQPGFYAFRLLRPLSSDTYVVLTEWSGPASFEAWKISDAFGQAHAKRDAATPENSIVNIFSGRPYITTYTTDDRQEED